MTHQPSIGSHHVKYCSGIKIIDVIITSSMNPWKKILSDKRSGNIFLSVKLLLFSLYIFIIRCITHNLNLNLKLKFCICIVYPIVIIYTPTRYIWFIQNFLSHDCILKSWSLDHKWFKKIPRNFCKFSEVTKVQTPLSCHRSPNRTN